MFPRVSGFRSPVTRDIWWLFPGAGVQQVRDKLSTKIDSKSEPVSGEDNRRRASASRIWGVCAYFNPQRSRLILRNYRLFRASLRQQGLPLLTVELAFARRAFALAGEDADLLVQVRADSVLWHKERLINIGMEKLPRECDQVVWLDADILFQNQNWVAETSLLLERYNAVQPFEFGIRLPEGALGIETDSLPLGRDVGMKEPSDARFKSDPTGFTFSLAGFAWAVRRGVLRDMGLYDRMILGMADSIISDALCGNPINYDRPCLKPSTVARDVEKWYAAVRDRVGDGVSFTPGHVLHLYHGLAKNRGYREANEGGAKRELIFNKIEFDPINDLRINSDGCLEWASDKPELHRFVRRYFWLRNDDSLLWRELCIRFIELPSNIARLASKIPERVRRFRDKCLRSGAA